MRLSKFSGVVLACAVALAAAPAVAQNASQVRPSQAQTQVAQPSAAPARSVAPPRGLAVRPDTITTATMAPAGPAINAVVAGNANWAPTRVTLQAGGFVRISATGRWSAVGQQLRAASTVNTTTDANGYPNTSGQPTLLPSANRGALIGRVGPNGAPFLIGATYEGAVREDGVLFLSMNDGAGQFTDNTGRLAVNISFTPPQAPPPVEETPPPTTTTTPNDPTGATTTPEQTDGGTTTTVETTTTVDPATGQTTTSVETTTATTADTTTDSGGAIAGIPQADLIRYGLIGLAGLVGLFLLSRLFAPRSGGRSNGDGEKKKNGASARVGTRVIDNGVSTQNLSIRVAGR